ncbi:MAG TPA: YdcF family protein [Candidatus Limnocylindrales bacterium]|nr:YdcF family protein [Candidatus Limnocylindrales bacterium]
MLGGGVLVRGIAIFLAGFTLLALVGDLRGRTADLALWFVDIRDLPRLVQAVLLGWFGVALAIWATAGAAGRLRRAAALVGCLVLAGFAARDVGRYASAVGSGQVQPAAPVPLSLVLTAGLLGMAIWIWRDPGLTFDRPWRARSAVVGAAVVTALAFPVLQIGFFGTTDYRRPADAAVILGARVYADGVPSPLLADRIATGIELYRFGLVPVLVMSGGDGTDGFNEALVMRDQAIAAGVDPSAILVDASGVNTDATVDHTLGLLAARLGSTANLRLIAVSQAYHLPRIQLAFSGAGIDVLTVPAVDPVPISEMPLLVAREIPAFWLYYVRACLG